jgi:predicted nucleic acid-binding protein
LATDSGCISFQVVQETLNVLTQKFIRPVPLDVANEILRHSLQPLWQVQPSAGLYTHALEVKERYRFSFYDSLIIAAALEAGCNTLYSEDLQHNQKVEWLTIINPFND